MNSIAQLFAVLMVVPAIGFAEVEKNEDPPGDSGAVSAAAQRSQRLRIEADIPYADTGNPRHRLDLYLPTCRTSEKLPVIVYFHGGGWRQGDKSDGAARLMPLLRSGEYAGVSAGYRLSGEATWPAQIHDGKAAIRWVRANASKYGLDPDRIGVWGRSAGGHLVLMLGVAGDVPELEGDIGPHGGVSSQVAGVANFFGVAELLAMGGQPGDKDRAGPNSAAAALIGGALNENPEKAKSASPITYVTSNDPPVLTVHGTRDRSVPYDQAVRMDSALRKAGVPSYFVTVKGAGHGDFGSEADDRVKTFFDKILLGKHIEISTETVTDWKR